jgi:amino acid transporter
MGWNYWYNWTIIQPAELSAASILIGFWTDINGAVWIALLMVLVFGINLLGARGYGWVLWCSSLGRPLT